MPQAPRRKRFDAKLLLLIGGLAVSSYLLFAPVFKGAPKQTHFALNYFAKVQQALATGTPVELKVRFTPAKGADRLFQLQRTPEGFQLKPQAGGVETFLARPGFLGKTKAGVLSPLANWKALPGLSENLEANYFVLLEGEETVLGRTARRLLIRPKRPGRPRETLLIDESTYLPLQAERFLPGGVRAWKYQVLDLEPLKKDQKETPTPAPVAKALLRPATLQTLVEKLGGPLWELQRLPEGFHKVGYFAFEPSKDTFYAETRYSDGFSNLSLYQERSPSVPAEGRKAFKYYEGWPRLAVLQKEGCELILAGELSRRLLETTLSSARPLQNEDRGSKVPAD